MSSIFISYRRVGALPHARALFERLRHEFGPNDVFIDLEGIDYGLDFVDILNEQLNGCKVMLAVIDPQWATATDRHGQRRIDREYDYVRTEIVTALSRGIRTVPVLIDGAEMPEASELPEPLRPLTRRNALMLDFTKFDDQVSRLIAVIRRIPTLAGQSAVVTAGAGELERREAARLVEEERQALQARQQAAREAHEAEVLRQRQEAERQAKEREDAQRIREADELRERQDLQRQAQEQRLRRRLETPEQPKAEQSPDVRNWRIPIALLLAPVIPYVVVALVFEVTGIPMMIHGVFGIVLSTAAACTISLVVGGIAYLVVRRFRVIGPVECLIAGGALGLIFGGLVGLVVGPLSGYVFWKIGLRPGKSLTLP
jgi:hypothetical protein